MFAFVPFYKDINGIVQDASLRIVESDDITAVYADNVRCSAFDPEEALTVRIGFTGEITDILSIGEMSPFWTEPSFPGHFDQIPDKTNFVLCQKADGTYAAVVSAVDKEYKSELSGREDGLICRVYSWYEGLDRCDDLLFVCGEGDNPFRLLADCYRTAAQLLGNSCKMREDRSYPEFLEYLGWCSWDSMQIRINEEGLKEKCEEFKAKNIPVRWAILDDMWAEIRDFYGKAYANKREMIQLMHASRMYSYHADPLRFPNGLKHTIEMINRYGIAVGMWLPTTGYWAGLDPEGEAYQELAEYTITTREGRVVPSYEADRYELLLRKILESFREAGVDFVKIDNQSMPRRHYKGFAPIGQIARGIGSGIEAVVKEIFDSRMINCMGMASETMWNRTESAVSRCSDDFQPEDRAWFRKHILQCTYNGLTQGQLFYNDYDMWWTDDEQAGKNSLLRAVSGGPVYISDEIGRSRRDVLEPLMLEDGRILRCDRPGLPTEDCLFWNPAESNKAFKVQNTVGGSGVIAVFHLSKDEDGCVTGTVSPSDVEGLTEGEYAVYEHFSGDCVVLRYNERLAVRLENADEYRLYVIVPIVNGFAAIGRTDKYISPATILHADPEKIVLKEKGPYAYVRDGILYHENKGNI